MVPIGGKPLLEHLLALLRHHDVKQVAINLHYKPQSIVDYFGDGDRFGLSIDYSYEDPILGSAGAIKKLGDFFDDTFVVIYGDLLTDLDISQLADFHRSKDALVTVALYQVEDPTRCGIVQTDQHGRISRFREKPPSSEVFSNLANAGVYIVEPAVMEYIPPDTFFDFGADLFPLLLEHHERVYGLPTTGYLLDIGSMQRYNLAVADAAGGRVGLYSFTPSRGPLSCR